MLFLFPFSLFIHSIIELNHISLLLHFRSDEEEEGQINPQNDGEELLLQSLCSATPSTQKYITKYVDDDLSAFLTKSAENRILDKATSASQVSRTIKAATRHIDALKKAPIPKDGLRHFSSPPSPRNIPESNQPSSTVPSIIESQVKELNRDEMIVFPQVKKRTRKKKLDDAVTGSNGPIPQFNCLPSRPVIESDEYRNKSSQQLPIPSERISFFKEVSQRIRRGKRVNNYVNGSSNKSSNFHAEEGGFNQLVYNQELRDLIWLEIQGWINDRSMIEQDSYICSERKSIPDMIAQINAFVINQRRYSFPVLETMCTTPRTSPVGSDDEDNVEEVKSDLRLLIDTEKLATSVATKLALENKFSDTSQCTLMLEDDNCSCSETLSRICQHCVSIETEAFEQVKDMICKMEAVESLYPCSKAMACEYPEYASSSTTSRIKSLNLFANITRDMREKIDLLAKLFGIQDRCSAGWPNYEQDCHSDEITSSLSTPEIKMSQDRQGYSFKLNSSHLTPKFDYFRESSSENQNSNGEKTLSAPESPDSNSYNTPTCLTTNNTNENCFFIPKQSIYRRYVDKALKHEKGLKSIHRQLSHILGPLFYRVHAALKKPSDLSYKDFQPSSTSLSSSSSWSKNPFPREYSTEVSLHGVWSPSYQEMGLPTFHRPFLFLLRLTVDVIHECLKLRLEQQPDQASAVSVAQLIRECKEVLKASFQIRQRYVNLAQTVLGEGGSDAIEAQLDPFDDDLKMMLQVYLKYLEQYMNFLQEASTKTTSTLKQKGYLENEWIFVRTFCIHIPEGESLAASRFCRMASRLLTTVSDYIHNGLQESLSLFKESFENSKEKRKVILKSFRNFKSVFQEASSRACQASAFAKSLRKDLEFAAEFTPQVDTDGLLLKLRETGHIRVFSPGCMNYLMFVPNYMQGHEGRIWHLLDLAAGGRGIDHEIETNGYLLVMAISNSDFAWQGTTVLLEPTIESSISLSHVQLEGILFVTNQPSLLETQCRRLEQLMSGTISILKQPTSCNKTIAKALTDLKYEALEIESKISAFLTEISDQVDESLLDGFKEELTLRERCLDVTHFGFKFAFEYHRSLTRLITGRQKKGLSEQGLKLALKWCSFVSGKSQLVAGRNRWVDQGLQFIHLVLEPQYLAHLDDDLFHQARLEINKLMHLLEESHEITSTLSDLRNPVAVLGPESSNLKPLASSLNFKRSQSVGCVNKLVTREMMDTKQKTRLEEWAQNKSNLKVNVRKQEKEKSKETVKTRDRILSAIQEVDERRREKLKSQGLIGDVSTPIQRAPIQITARKVNFAWQRGFKIGKCKTLQCLSTAINLTIRILGEGRFGKVFTAVNNSTGELIAMKEIHLQTNDHRAVKETIDEIKTFEGIKHPNLVRYFGVEIHREELYIFMEFCNEGNLESAVQFQLPEQLIRKYTRQLLDAVNVLHENGIVHRDIKSKY